MSDEHRVPYIGYSNATLAKMPEVKEGDLIHCSHCGGSHPLITPMTTTGEKGIIGITQCSDGNSYLSSVAGRLVAFEKADVSGSLPDPTP